MVNLTVSRRQKKNFKTKGSLVHINPLPDDKFFQAYQKTVWCGKLFLFIFNGMFFNVNPLPHGAAF